MSLLSNRIRELVNEREETIASISKNGKFNKNTIRRIMSGEKFPSKKNYSKLCEVLRLSPIEKDELDILFEIEYIGEPTYSNRKNVVNLISTISKVIEEITTLRDTKIIGESNEINTYNKNYQIFTDPQGVIKLIKKCIDTELCSSNKPKIQLAISYQMKEVYEYIFKSMLESSKNLIVHDIICLPKEVEQINSNCSLNVLHNVIGLALLNNVEYHSNYFESLHSDFGFETLFPFFILTTNCIITIERDFKSAVLYYDKELIELYFTYYKNLFAKTDEFISESNKAIDLYKGENSFGVRQLIGGVFPCFLTKESQLLLEQRIKNDYRFRKEMSETIFNFQKSLNEEIRSEINVFSLGCLRDFMDKGILFYPEEIFTCYSSKERLNMIKRLREDLLNERIQCQAINIDTKFLMNSITFINNYTTIQLLIHYKKGVKYNTKKVSFKEAGIVKIFDDYFMSLKESDFILSIERTIEEVDAIICDYEEA